MWTQQTKLLQITAFSVGITKLNQRIIWKDDIEFVTEFLCLLGHPVALVQYVMYLKLTVDVIVCDQPFVDCSLYNLQQYPFNLFTIS